MRRSPGRMLLRFVVLLAALIAAHRATYSEVASTTLRKHSAQAKAIAIARVDKVETIGWVRVATATVLRPFKGMRAQQRFAFLAQGTWTCDESYARTGETALIFLQDPSTSTFVTDFLAVRPWFNFLRARRLGGIPFYRIAHSGAGRIPIQRKNGRDYLMAWTPYSLAPRPTARKDSGALRIGVVKMPTGIPAYRYLSTDMRIAYLMQLRDVEQVIQKLVGPSKDVKPAARVPR